MDEKVPGGHRVAFAEDGGAALHDESNDGDGGYLGSSAGKADRTSQWTASQSLPRFLDGGEGTGPPSSEPRKVDSLPIKIIDESYTNAGDRKTRAKKMIRSFGSFVQKVARQLTSVAFYASPTSRLKEVDVGPDGGDSDASSAGRSASSNSPKLSGRVHIRLAASEAGEVPPGVIGIHNHGNTCFMNAVLQCLSNTELLLSYFIMDQYKDDMKRSNKHTARKFGTKGELTEHLATLLKSLWTCKYTPEISSKFKATVAKYGCQYRGSSQHDAQEFLIWLLDKVHEDLNIAMKKKYRANKSSHGRTDEEVAAEALANHARCNNSFIYDIFQALYRSSLTCPNCYHRSTTFDPFLSVSLPIPHKTNQPVYVTVVQGNGTLCRFGFLFEQDWLVTELRQATSQKTGDPINSVILLEIENSGAFRIMNDSFVMNELSENVVIYALNTPFPVPSPVSQSTPCDMLSCGAVVTGQDVTVVVVKKLVNGPESQRFGAPLLFELSSHITLTELKRKILLSVVRLVPEQDAINDVVKESFSLKFDETVLLEDIEEYAVPLMSEKIKEALSRFPSDFGPRHVLLCAEWETNATLPMSINESVEDHETVRQMKSSLNQSSLGTLDECFQVYTQEEQLGPDNAWLCPSCLKYQQGTVKALTLWSLPEVLVVHLKRFRLDTVHRTKLNTLVVFPINGLDMRNHVQKANATTLPSTLSRSVKSGSRTTWKQGRKTVDSEDYLYDLYAVCNHYGDMHGGHYTAFCKNLCDKKWYSYNDNKATEMREADVITRAAYLLFYQKRATNFPRSHDWLNTLKQVDYSVPRAVTSHSLDDLLDGDCDTSVADVSPDDDFRRNIPVYTTQSPPDRIIRRASARQAKVAGTNKSREPNGSLSLLESTAASDQTEALSRSATPVVSNSIPKVSETAPLQSDQSVAVRTNGKASSDDDSRCSSPPLHETIASVTDCSVTGQESKSKDTVSRLTSGCNSVANNHAASTKSFCMTSTSL